MSVVFFFFQAEDGIRDLVRSRGLGDVYKRQPGIQRHGVGAVLQDVAGEDQVDAGNAGVAGDEEALSLIHI